MRIIYCFNPRSRTGSDEVGATVPTGDYKFQSTLPHGERRWGLTSSILLPCFNPRSRTGSDGINGNKYNWEMVSIHAPARGATLFLQLITPYIIVSIHAPARGATRRDKWISLEQWVSIHAPARGATKGNDNSNDNVHVSIHAPARGATADLKHHQLQQKFQSTLPHGERLTIHRGTLAHPLFQSTLPHGERPSMRFVALRITLFQSTLPHGERRL